MSRAFKLSLHTFFVAAAVLLTACARDMSYMEMRALMPAPPAEKGRIYFYREPAWLGNVVTPDILLNDESVGISNPGAFFYVDRDPGAYRAICGKGEDNAISFSLAAGQEVYIRTSVAGGIITAQMQTVVVASEAAVPAMRSLRYDAVK